MLIVSELVKAFFAVYGTRSFISLFRRANHWSFFLVPINLLHTFPACLVALHF